MPPLSVTRASGAVISGVFEALPAGEAQTDACLPARLREYLGTFGERWVMTHVLRVATLQVRYPVIFIIQVEAGDALQRWRIHADILARISRDNRPRQFSWRRASGIYHTRPNVKNL